MCRCPWLFIILTLCRFESAYTWASGGHMAVAEIAYEQLHPHSKEKCDELIDLLTPFYPESDTFVKASIWLDTVHLHDFRFFWKCHFTTIPYDPEGILTECDHKRIQAINEGADILYGLEHAIKTLSSHKAKPLEKALMLRYLIHAAADAHQPLHTAALYDSHFPNGDQGGNQFFVESPLTNKLHLLWDLGLGCIPVIEFKEEVSEESLLLVQHFARYLHLTYPKESFAGKLNLPKESWIQEAYEIATLSVYTLKPGSAPSVEYINNGRLLSERQMTLAGYRLGALLNDIFENN